MAMGEGTSSSISTEITTSQPKFFKTIVSPHECRTLSIPQDFGIRYCKNMQNLVYLEVPSKQVWVVEVVHAEGQSWLAKGWQDFSDYYSISCGHLLMFEYNGCSHFNVTMSSLSATEIEYSYTAHHALKRDQTESDDDDSVEIMGHCSLGKANKRKRTDPASASFAKKGQKGQGDGTQIVRVKNKAVMDKERSIAYQRAKTFKSKNPFIILFMQPSYVFSPYCLNIAFSFARQYFPKNCRDLVLRIPCSAGVWSVRFHFTSTKNAKICGGWKAFVVDNKLKVGDVCVFEVIKSRGTEILIDVTIFPAAGRTPMHAENKLVPPKVVEIKKAKQRRGGSCGFNSNIKEEHGEGSEVDRSDEILRHCLLEKGSKRIKLEREADDDVSIDIYAKNIKVENSQEDVAAPSYTKNGRSCRRHKKQAKIVYEKNMTVMDKEKTLAYQRAKAFKSENPFIISFMQPSYVSKTCVLFISSTFARKYLQENCGNLVLRVPGSGFFWCVRCTIGSGSGRIHSGWKSFAVDNKLKSGDVCVFEVIKGAQLFIDVTIFRAAGKVPAVSSCKNKNIKTEHFHSRELNLEKQERGDSYRFTPRIKEELSQGAGKQANQSKSTGMKGAVAKDMVMAYERAKAFTPENPFFICFMQPYASPDGPIQLSIMLPIAWKFFTTRHSDVVLQVSNKKWSWPVKCTLGTTNAKLTSGWKEFVLDNDLKVGDVCIFERVSKSKLLFNVIIFPAGESS